MALGGMFSVVSICWCLSVYVCEHNDFWDIIVKFLLEQDIVQISDEFENCCIPMLWGLRVMIVLF